MKVELLRNDMTGHDTQRLADLFDAIVEERDIWQWRLSLDENGRLIVQKRDSSQIVVIEE